MKPPTEAQISLRLPPELLRQLEEEARERGLTRSTLVRELLRQALAADPLPSTPWDRVSELVGAYRLGVKDLGARHREHLGAIIRDRR